MRSFVHRPLILLISVAFVLLLGAWQVMAAVAPQSLHRLVAAYTGTTADIATASDVANLHPAHVQPTTAGQLKAGQTVVMRDGRTMVVQSVSQSPAPVPSTPALVTPAVASASPSSSSSSSGGGDWILAPDNLPQTPPTNDVPPLPVAHSAQDLGFHPVKVQHMENVGDRVILTCFNPETNSTETLTGKQGRDTVFTLKNPDTDELPTSQIKDVEPGNLVATRNPQTGKTEFGRVVRTIQRQTDALVTLRLADSKTGQAASSLTCTPEHPYYVQGQGWVEAGSLGIGSSIVTRAGPPLVVKGVDWQRAKAGTKPFTVYNFEVAGSHTYFVGKDNGGAWVHNQCAPDLAEFGPNDKFPHYRPNPNGEGAYKLWRPTEDGQGYSAMQEYDAEGYAVRRTDFLSRSGRTDHDFPHHHEMQWTPGSRNPGGAPKVGNPVDGLP